MVKLLKDEFVHLDMFIDGKFCPSSNGEVMEVHNPATGKVGSTVPKGTEEDVNAAIDSAKEGFKIWRETHPAERARVMLNVAQAIRDDAEYLARLVSLNGGGSIAGSLNTVTEVCARRFEYFAGLADKILGDTFITPGEQFGFTLREPKGVTGHIIPWNGPLWIGSRSIAPALAAGNSIVVKPSREAPLSLIKLAEIAHKSGLPAGVMNVVTGPSNVVGNALTAHPDISAIYHTGSGATAKLVLANASQHFAYTVMELGGKSPNIVFADAEIEPALYGTLWGIFANAGQICVAGSRLLVEESIHDQFIKRLIELVQGLRLGGPDQDADMGPVISERQRESILGYINIGKEEGELVTGGRIPDDPSLKGGYFLEPTIFDYVSNSARIAQEEVFGPVLTVTPFKDQDEAITYANNTEFGLASAVWTTNIKKALYVTQRIEAAQVYVNQYFSTGFELTRTPYKASGFGHSEGLESINEYLNTKAVSVKLGN